MLRGGMGRVEDYYGTLIGPFSNSNSFSSSSCHGLIGHNTYLPPTRLSHGASGSFSLSSQLVSFPVLLQPTRPTTKVEILIGIPFRVCCILQHLIDDGRRN